MKKIEWTEEMIAGLGKFNDSVLAKKLNIAIATVREKRQSLGVPPLIDRIKLPSQIPPKKLQKLCKQWLFDSGLGHHWRLCNSLIFPRSLVK